MELLISVVLCSLATFRLAELFVIDDGPFEVFVNLRGWLNKSPQEGLSVKRMLFNLFSCVHCTGFWIALIFGFFSTKTLFGFIIFSLAVAGLQSLISNNLGRK